MDKDEAGFLATLVANPADRTAQLVFADWLDEHDDPRAVWFRNESLGQRLAANATRWMAHDPRGLVPPLLDALGNGESLAGDLLQALGSAVIPSLRAWVREAEPDVFARWGEARWAIEASPPPELRPVPELAGQLGSDSWYQCWEAVLDLGFHGPTAAPATTALVALCERRWDWEGDWDRDPLERLIHQTLGKIGPGAMEAVPLLAGACYRADEAHAALLAIGPDPDLVYQHICCDNDSMARSGVWLVQELDSTGTGALIRILKCADGRGSNAAAEILGDMGAKAADAVPAMIEVFGSLTGEGYNDHYLRGLLATAFGKIGEAARAAVPMLRAAMTEYQSDADGYSSFARDAIAGALAELGDPGAGLVALLPQLTHHSEYVRASAVQNIGAIAARFPEAIPHVLAAFTDSSAHVRNAAMDAVGGLASAECDPNLLVPALFAAFADTDEGMRGGAASVLGRLKDTTKYLRKEFFNELTLPLPPAPDGESDHGLSIDSVVLARLICLARTDPALPVRCRAVDAFRHWDKLPPTAAGPLLEVIATGSISQYELSSFFSNVRYAKPVPEELFPQILALFTHTDAAIAGGAADLMTTIAKENPNAIVPLIAGLSNSNAAVVTYSVRALHNVGPAVAAALPQLVPLASDSDPTRRRLVVSILGELDQPDAVLPVLRDALADPEAEVRAAAISSLGRLPAHSLRDVFPLLRAAATDPHSDVRFAVIPVLALAEDTAVSDLLGMATDADPWVRRTAFQQLAVLRPAFSLIEAAFRNGLIDPEASVRTAVLEQLNVLGGVAAPILEDMLRRCREEEPGVRSAAIAAIAAACGDPDVVISEARKLLLDSEESVRTATAHALASLRQTIAPLTPEFIALCRENRVEVPYPLLDVARELDPESVLALVPVFREHMASESWSIRNSAALGLRAIGADGLNMLREALNDPNPNVRAAAEDGLRSA